MGKSDVVGPFLVDHWGPKTRCYMENKNIVLKMSLAKWLKVIEELNALVHKDDAISEKDETKDDFNFSINASSSDANYSDGLQVQAAGCLDANANSE